MRSWRSWLDASAPRAAVLIRFAVGSRSRTVRPERWGVEKHGDEAVTEDIFVAGVLLEVVLHNSGNDDVVLNNFAITPASLISQPTTRSDV